MILNPLALAVITYCFEFRPKAVFRQSVSVANPDIVEATTVMRYARSNQQFYPTATIQQSYPNTAPEAERFDSTIHPQTRPQDDCEQEPRDGISHNNDTTGP